MTPSPSARSDESLLFMKHPTPSTQPYSHDAGSTASTASTIIAEEPSTLVPPSPTFVYHNPPPAITLSAPSPSTSSSRPHHVTTARATTTATTTVPSPTDNPHQHPQTPPPPPPPPLQLLSIPSRERTRQRRAPQTPLLQQLKPLQLPQSQPQRIVHSHSLESNPTSWISVSTAALDASIPSVPTMHSCSVVSANVHAIPPRSTPAVGAPQQQQQQPNWIQQKQHHSHDRSRDRDPDLHRDHDHDRDRIPLHTRCQQQKQKLAVSPNHVRARRRDDEIYLLLPERQQPRRKSFSAPSSRQRSPALLFSPAVSEASFDACLTPPSPSVVLRNMMSASSNSSSLDFKVEMRMEAYDLLNKDTFSLSDPFAVLYADHFGIGLEELGRTETVYDDLNPRWQTRFVFPYRRSRHANIIVEIYDRDDARDDAPLTKHDFLGRAEVDLRCVLDQPGGRLRVKLRRAEGVTKGRGKRGYLSVFAEILHDTYDGRGIARFCSLRGVGLPGVIVLNFSVASMRRKGGVHSLCGSTSIVQFYEIFRERTEAGGGKSWTTVYRSEDGQRITESGHVLFAPVVLVESAMHNSQPTRALRFVVYKRNLTKKHDVLCYAETSAAELVRRSGTMSTFTQIPLRGEDMELLPMGVMQVLDLRKSCVREDAIEIDAVMNMHSRDGYVSELSEAGLCRKRIVNYGLAGYVRKQVSLH